MDFIRLDALLVFIPSTTGGVFIEGLVLKSMFVARSKLALRMNCSGLAICLIRSLVVHVSITGVWLSKASFSAIFGLIFVVIDLHLMIRLTSSVAKIWLIIVLPMHGFLILASQLIS